MDLVVEHEAAKVLARMQPKIASAIIRTLRSVAVAPFAPHRNVKRLRGDKDYFRLRRGDWRVLYRVDQTAGQVIVEAVVTRGDAYR
ncbi:MAG: type II toxin-antitoxin system RelE/ParE family toxin [Rhodospirillales bacterium]|nr:type II toxin-antitoxin system RelE/ParE family toxin [Rhodospirillales bacterium]